MHKALEVYEGVLQIPSDMTAIPEGFCAGREDIRRILLPQSVYSIGPEAFSECTALEEVVFPEELLFVSPAAFLNCTALEKVILPRKLRSINEGAFLGCEALRSISLPASLEAIDEMAFWGSGLEEITVPHAVEQIGENAFWDCAALRRVDILGQATRIGKNAFGNCPALVEGFVAPGYPEDDSPPAQLLYTLLWCSCPERHTEETAKRAKAFIAAQESLVMERIIKNGNTAAMEGIATQRLLDPVHIDEYLRICAEMGNMELTALLLQAKGSGGREEEEFAL
ncbi:MAG: leucine-rich repeat protein [Oscillospiraceae bacterium]|nr:leucine-rich repeat protein [Oscillospiraceae bacterium]